MAQQGVRKPAFKLHVMSIPGSGRKLTAPDFISYGLLDELKILPLKDDDLFIVTFPKSGTTWVQQIVRLLRYGMDDRRILVDAVPWIEALDAFFSYIKIDEMESPRTFKSHLPYDLLPTSAASCNSKYIYVARNPKDVCVSLYRQDLIIRDPTMTWNSFFQDFMKGAVPFGDYFNHVLEWWGHKDDEHVLFLKYEDMKKDLASAVQHIAEFIECEGATQEKIDEIVSRTSFTNMREDTTANYSWSKFRDPSKEEENFLRKGEVGDWKNYFTPEQSVEMDEMYARRMAGSGLEFDFGV